MLFHGVRTTNLLIVLFLLGLVSCGGCAGSGAETQASLPIGDSSFLVSGTVQVPASGAVSSLSSVAVRALAAGGPNSIRYITANETTASQAVCELIDSDGTVIDTATCDENGAYAFDEVTGSVLDDAGDASFTTFYVRCTVTEDDGSTFVEMMTVSESDSELAGGDGEVSEDEADAFTGLEVDPGSTAETLLDYQGSGINPLTAGEGEFPDDGSLNIPLLDTVNEALVDGAMEDLEDTETVEDVDGQTMDNAILTYLVSVYALMGDTIEGQTADETLNEFFNLDPDSEDAAAIEAEIANEDAYASLVETDIEGSYDSLDSFQDAVEGVWLGSDEFQALLEGNSGLLGFFIGAALDGKTLSQFEAMNASAELLEAQLGLIDGFDLDLLTATNELAALEDALSHFLDPELILVLLQDPDAATALGALLADLFDGEAIDLEITQTLSGCMSGNAGDTAFWDQFVSDGAVNDDYLGNFYEFVDLGVDAGYFDEFYAGTAIFEWDDFFSGIDLSQDWSGYDATSYAEFTGDLYSQTMVDVDPESCEHFCGTMASSGCWCDDACVYYGDCCGDKVDACGENYSADLMTQYGYDLSSLGVEFADSDEDYDGDGVPYSEDDCPYYYDPEQTDSDADGIGDACEDADYDGTPDSYDNCPSAYNWDQSNVDYWNDSDGDECDDDDDGDGIADAEDTCPLYYDSTNADTDGDGVGDYCDGTDSDGDTWIDDYDNCPAVDNPWQSDSDGDGNGDECDDDIDGDGTANDADSCPYFADDSYCSDYSGYGATDDADWDYVTDTYDNCPNDYNYDQADSDSDGAGDSCDDDDDGDGVNDYDSQGYTLDNCRVVANADQADADGDGVGDACNDYSYYYYSYASANDTDADYDGLSDAEDNCPYTEYYYDTDDDCVYDSDDNCYAIPNADQADINSDGAGDACDDFDGDGYYDDMDNCVVFYNNQSDTNADGVGDACESYPYDYDNDGYTVYNGYPSYSSLGYSDADDHNAAVH